MIDFLDKMQHFLELALDPWSQFLRKHLRHILRGHLEEDLQELYLLLELVDPGLVVSLGSRFLIVLLLLRAVIALFFDALVRQIVVTAAIEHGSG